MLSAEITNLLCF